MNNCIYCGAPLDDDSQFCTNCGKKVAPQGKMCPQCGAEIEDDAAFCSKCGTRLDVQTEPPASTPQVVIPETSSQEEEIVYEWEEEKDRKWRYIIGGIVVIAIVSLGWYFYSTKLKPQKNDSVELTLEKETSFVELIKKWDEMHNNKQFDDSSNCPYAETVYFYGTKMSGRKAAQAKQKAVEGTDYHQESTIIKITRISDKLVVCDFEKRTQSNGKTKNHPDCYLFFEDEGAGVWKIKEESDKVTDNNLMNERIGDSCEEVILPITLQFIREYCDHLQLPYNYWTYVENEIVEQRVNVSVYYESLFSDSYASRARVAMNYKYPNGNDVLEKSSHYDYLCFCDAIGRIKEVWKVVPVRIESGDDESPLLQFRYEEGGAKDVIFTAQYVQDGVEAMDDIPIYHYKYVTDDNREANFDMFSY